MSPALRRWSGVLFVLLCVISVFHSGSRLLEPDLGSNDDHYRPHRSGELRALLPPQELEVGLVFQSSIPGAEKNTTLCIFEAQYALLPHKVTLGTGPRFVVHYLSRKLPRSHRVIPQGYRIAHAGTDRACLLERAP